MTQRRRRLGELFDRDEGAILVLTSFIFILLFVLAAIAVDLSFMSQRRQHLWNSADAAALAGASQLPDDAAAAEALARQYAADNDSDLATGLDVSFRCLVPDADNDGQPDAGGIPTACDPATAVPLLAPPFVCDGGVCAVPCDPSIPGAKCNTIVLSADKEVPYNFAPVIGIDEGQTNVRSAACRGTCGGGSGGAVDLMLIIDRTTSMSSADLQAAKDASLAVLDHFNPSLHHVGLAALGSADPTNLCAGEHPDDGGTWLITGLSNDYKDLVDLDVTGDGLPDLDSSSDIVSKIQCINHFTGTDLGSPINDVAFGRPDALSHLLSAGRPGVKKGIILLSDGAAVRPSSFPNHCQYAEDMAGVAKSAGVEIFTIGLGIGSKHCDDDSGTYDYAPVPQLLAAMATGPTDDNCVSGGENTDGDHFFCEPTSADLSQVFLAAAAQFASGSSLVYLPAGG